MQESMSELARKYREEMMQLYEKSHAGETVSAVPAAAPAAVTPAAVPSLPETDPEEFEEANEENAADSPFSDASETDGDGFEEPELPSYIRPSPPTMPEEWEAQQAYEARNTAEGKLRVVTATAQRAYPVPGARVAVFTHIGSKRHLSYLLTTNESGETPTVTLPAPPASLSQESKNVSPYALCDIEVYAVGFFRAKAVDVHIFAGIITRQVFELIPLPLFPGEDSGVAERAAGMQ